MARIHRLALKITTPLLLRHSRLVEVDTEIYSQVNLTASKIERHLQFLTVNENLFIRGGGGSPVDEGRIVFCFDLEGTFSWRSEREANQKRAASFTFLNLVIKISFVPDY